MIAIFAGLQARYPNWISSKSEEEMALIKTEWCSDIFEFREHDSKWVWGKIKEACRAKAGDFPPGLDAICAHLGRASKDIRRQVERDEERLRLESEKENRTDPETAKARIKEIVDMLAEKRGLDAPKVTGDSESRTGPTTEEEWNKWMADQTNTTGRR